MWHLTQNFYTTSGCWLWWLWQIWGVATYRSSSRSDIKLDTQPTSLRPHIHSIPGLKEEMLMRGKVVFFSCKPFYFILVPCPILDFADNFDTPEGDRGCIGEDALRRGNSPSSCQDTQDTSAGSSPTVSKWKLQPTFQCQMSVSGPIWCQKRFAGKFLDWKKSRQAA